MSTNLSVEKFIELIDNLVSNFDPTPVIVNTEFPLRWESNINISDYDFDDNYLDLDQNYERSNGEFLKSIGSAIVLNKEDDGSLEYWDGIYMFESHTWCSKLNTNNEYPSFSLINKKFRNQDEFIAFLIETYGF
ncbi:MAG: hypothetical protein RL422_236 [Bacteroidota bacterium]|jgi:hypothetical protein